MSKNGMLSVQDSSALSEWRAYWPLVLATASGMALAAMLSATFGVMLEPMENDLGWSRAEISTGPAVVSFMSLFLSAPTGHLIDRLGSRVTGIFVVFAKFTAITLMSQAHELWHWWAAWGVFGIAAGFTSTVWLAPVSTIFNKARGMAIALTLAGAGISGAVAPPLAEYFIQNYDWRIAFLALAAVWCGIALVLVLAFVPPKKRAISTASDAEIQSMGAPELEGFSAREGLRSRSLYLLFFGALIGNMAGLAILLNLVPVLTFSGLGRAEAVAIAGLVGLTSIFGRLAGGWLLDTFDPRRLAVIAALSSMVFPATIILAPGIAWIATAALMFNALAGGVKMGAVVYLTSTHLGPRGFGLFFGIIGINTSIAMGIGPLLANYIFDQTQSYLPVIWAAFPCYLIAASMYAALGKAPDFSQRAAQD